MYCSVEKAWVVPRQVRTVRLKAYKRKLFVVARRRINPSNPWGHRPYKEWAHDLRLNIQAQYDLDQLLRFTELWSRFYSSGHAVQTITQNVHLKGTSNLSQDLRCQRMLRICYDKLSNGRRLRHRHATWIVYVLNLITCIDSRGRGQLTKSPEKERTFHTLLQQLKYKINQLQKGSLALTFWILGAWQERDIELVKTLIKRVMMLRLQDGDSNPRFSTVQIARILWSMATLEVRHFELIETLLSDICENQNPELADLATILWACAKLRISCSQILVNIADLVAMHYPAHIMGGKNLTSQNVCQGSFSLMFSSQAKQWSGYTTFVDRRFKYHKSNAYSLAGMLIDLGSLSSVQDFEALPDLDELTESNNFEAIQGEQIRASVVGIKDCTAPSVWSQVSNDFVALENRVDLQNDDPQNFQIVDNDGMYNCNIEQDISNWAMPFWPPNGFALPSEISSSIFFSLASLKIKQLQLYNILISSICSAKNAPIEVIVRVLWAYVMLLRADSLFLVQEMIDTINSYSGEISGFQVRCQVYELCLIDIIKLGQRQLEVCKGTWTRMQQRLHKRFQTFYGEIESIANQVGLAQVRGQYVQGVYIEFGCYVGESLCIVNLVDEFDRSVVASVASQSLENIFVKFGFEFVQISVEDWTSCTDKSNFFLTTVSSWENS